jgi:hypothetical protein
MDQRFAALDRAGAREMTRQETTRWLRDKGVTMQLCMGLQVEYERATGRRSAGRSCAGTYQAAATRTLGAGLDETLRMWARLPNGRTSLSDHHKKVAEKAAADEWKAFWRDLLRGVGRQTPVRVLSE